KGLSPSITSLELNANKIVSIKNNTVSELKNLKELYMDQNCYYSNPCGKTFEKEDEAFVALTNLTVLSLSYNNLTREPLNLPSSLRELYLGFNKITRISQGDFNELVNLHLLDLSRNCPRCCNAPFPCEPCIINSSIQIHQFAFQNLKKLKILVLTSTSLTSVPAIWLQNMTQLKALHLAFNYLQNEIASGEFLRELTSLEELDLSFSFEEEVYLSYLNLSQHFSSLVSLKRLHLKGYIFQDLCEKHLQPLIALKKQNILDLGIHFIKQIDLAVFQDFSNLTEIYLTDCQPSPSVMQKYKKIDHFLYYIIGPQCSSDGKALDMSSNSLIFINPNQFKSFKDIACLNLSSNGISQAFNGTEFNLTKLKYLDSSNNKLDFAYGFAFNEMKLLKVLDLTHNKHYFRLAGVTLRLAFIEKLPQLKVLNLSWNVISTLTDRQLSSKSPEELIFFFKNLGSLTYIDISHNRPLKIPARVFLSLPPNLTQLFLSNNRLQVLIFANLSRLKYLKLLDLSQNNFRTVHISFKQSLLLRCNRISEIAVDFSNTNGSLLFLDSSHNKLKYMNQSTLVHIQKCKIFKVKGQLCNLHTCTLEEVAATLFYVSFFAVIMLIALRFHLEENGDKHILLCLEERDWEPGKAVIDNLAQSIHHSRKTIFVLTERYVKNGIFKTAFYIALQRLMDENTDVIVFILLEPVLQHSQYLRLRRRICKSSVLDWAKNPHAEGLFWQRLKSAVLTDNSM
uniref:TIR domain-containing protein n=1 Tax=Gopherus evgoodei TaxID=1825980 RepID=A0A8C4W0J4_9SAUR